MSALIGAGCEAVFNLNCPGGPPQLRENFGFSLAQVGKIKSALSGNLPRLCAEWDSIHENI